MDLFERWASQVEITDSCWIWHGTRTQLGYGRFNFQGKTYVAHRVGFEFFKGPIPDGFPLDHLCRNHPCCNPFHLDAVPHRENIRRGLRGGNDGGWLPCPHGASARRHCKPCLAEKMREFRKKRKVA